LLPGFKWREKRKNKESKLPSLALITDNEVDTNSWKYFILNKFCSRESLKDNISCWVIKTEKFTNCKIINTFNMIKMRVN
jgi:hypothetical protein